MRAEGVIINHQRRGPISRKMPVGPRETRNDDRALHRTAPLSSAREYALACGQHNTRTSNAGLAIATEIPIEQANHGTSRCRSHAFACREAEHGEFQVGKRRGGSAGILIRYLKIILLQTTKHTPTLF